jgi:AraC-like DNA-binding protein
MKNGIFLHVLKPGFKTLPHFLRVFKQQFGYAPTK